MSYYKFKFKKLDFSDVLIVPQGTNINSREDANLITESNFKYSSLTLKCVPIMAANMDTVGTIQVMKTLAAHSMFTCLSKYVTISEFQENADFLKKNLDNFAVSIGFDVEELKRLTTLNSIVPFKTICIDVANGYMDSFVDFCATVRKNFPEKILIAGNVCTSAGVYSLIVNGKVDIVKCGIGSGSACTTRLKTGVGYPQMSCVDECATMAHIHGAKIISDGGITCPGDVAKAFGGGADFVMIGGQFAGHDECPGELITENGQQYKIFYGMSSSYAMVKRGMTNKTYCTSEGRLIKIKLKGPLENTVLDFLGGLRSACVYTDKAELSEMIDNVHFVRVNHQFNTSLLNK